MATRETALCRICSTSLTKQSISLFSRECIASDSGLAERLSRVIDVPVIANDGLSQHICRPCNRKFVSAESFRVLAKASYEKNRTSLAKASYEKNRTSLPRPLTGVTGSPKSTHASRKRSKDTSGVGVSPHTQQVRPTAKRQTVGASGRRLCFRVQDESKIIYLLSVQ